MTAPILSIIVVSYNMARELPRTIFSLGRSYQKELSSVRYEIIVADNGSAHPPDLTCFSGIDADIRILLCESSAPSPVGSINAALHEANAPLIGIWIDGARLASPGLLAACLKASALHARPVIATLNFQLGPALQYLSVERGYDQRQEDTLLAAIEWPSDGYRLFDIATCELRHGTAGPMLESNALFLPKSLWYELGGYDLSFIEPAGGAVNADTLIRACALPDVQLIRVLGEGTFHQYHGGLSTSSASGALRTLHEGSRAYRHRRGRPLQPVRDIGWLYDGQRGIVM
jgi:hypothetical protein